MIEPCFSNDFWLLVEKNLMMTNLLCNRKMSSAGGQRAMEPVSVGIQRSTGTLTLLMLRTSIRNSKDKDTLILLVASCLTLVGTFMQVFDQRARHYCILWDMTERNAVTLFDKF